MSHLYIISGTGRCRYTLNAINISSIMDEDFNEISTEFIWDEIPEESTTIYHIQYWDTYRQKYAHVYCFSKNMFIEAINNLQHQEDLSINIGFLE